MTEAFANFQFLRPWFLLLLPILWLLQVWWQRRSSLAGWKGHIAADKIAVLRIDSNRSRFHPLALFGTSLLVCVALAGPSLHTLPGKVAGNRQAMVILFDLSPSMLARDVAPSRLAIAQLKLIDLLRRRSDGETALIAYAGDAHRVSPLTDDHTIIENLVHTLHPEIMPLQGNRPEAAIALALKLFAGAKLAQGDIVFITDGIPEDAALSMNSKLPDSYRVSVLAVGTPVGAPIPSVDSGFLRDSNGNIVMASVDSSVMHTLTQNHNGRFATNTADSKDIDYLSGLKPLPFRARVKGKLQTFDRQHDAGYWVAMLMIPLVLYGFRRQVLWVVIPIALISPESHALDWIDLWRTPNQQAAAALQRDDTEQAQLLFKDTKWKAVAAFRHGNFTYAVDLFEQATTADDYYNLGTSLAATGEFAASINALDEALALYENPDSEGFTDALLNRALVLQWIEQEQQQIKEEESTDSSADNDKQDGPSDESDVEGEESDRAATPADQPTVGGTVGAGNSLDQAQLDQQGISGSRQETPEDETGDTPNDTTAVNQPGAISGSDKQDGYDADSSAVVIEDHNNPVLNPYSEQWLRNLPQDPGGYMRRKFAYQAQINALTLAADVTLDANQTTDLIPNQNKPSVNSLPGQPGLDIDGLRY